MRDEDYDPKLHTATLSAVEAVASLILCTVHDGIQSVSQLLTSVLKHLVRPLPEDLGGFTWCTTGEAISQASSIQAVKSASLVACVVVLSSFELACAAALLLSTSTLFACSQCVSIALHVGRLRSGEVHADLSQD